MKKKLIAPIIIAIMIVIYYIGIAVVFSIMADIPHVAKIAMFVVPFVLVGVMIYVLIERIKEIKDGEEDDLSKY